MKLFVGLGNPGSQYAGHRHNIGYRAIEAIAAGHGFALWRSKFQGQISEGRLGAERVVLLKPETFMNRSGDAVQAAMQFFKLDPADAVAFHDDLDLPPGKLRVKTGGGTGGHNGLRSIEAQIGPDFTRVRLGIGHPGDKRLVTPYVLGNFADADRDWVDPLLAGIAAAAPALAAGDTAGFASAVAQRIAPPTAPAAPPLPEPAADDRGHLQRLIDRFR